MRNRQQENPVYQDCPIRNVIDKFGDRWSMLVLSYLEKFGQLRFSELWQKIPDISQKMLAKTLQRLEAMGLISRTAYAEVPPRVEYALTEEGRSLMPHLNALIGWAGDYFAKHKKTNAITNANLTENE